MNVLLLSRYGALGASSRVRLYQFLPALHTRGIDVTVSPLLDDQYLRNLYAGAAPAIPTIVRGYTRRIAALLGSGRFDLVWLEKEALPWVPFVLEGLLTKAGVPIVADYDDAVFHRYDKHGAWLVRRLLGGKIDAVMRRAAVVVAGNEYLADRATRAGARRTVILPSVVDTSRYQVRRPPEGEGCHIGWIGSPATAKYLDLLREPLRAVASVMPLRVTLVGATANALAEFRPEVLRWSADDEVAQLNRFDIGVMPLPDGAWEQGKCGFKLVQYLACGRPAVASPVGMNVEIVVPGSTGFLASSGEEWAAALRRLALDPEQRTRMGTAGRQLVVSKYSTHAALPILVDVFQTAVRQGSRSRPHRPAAVPPRTGEG